MKIRWYHMWVYRLFRLVWNPLLRNRQDLCDLLEACFRSYRTGDVTELQQIRERQIRRAPR